MSNTFCRALSNAYRVSIVDDELSYLPCCFYDHSKSIKLLDRATFEKQMAYNLTATNWLPECGECRRMENSDKNQSPRLGSFLRIPEDVENGVCVDLEVHCDINCNAACLSCNGGSSTAWRKYDHKHSLFDYGPEDRTERLVRQLIDTVPMDQLRNLYILGGEPFYSNTHLQIIEHVLKVHPAPSKIVLSYQTNGSLFPGEEIQVLWSKFKKVLINVSIDGTYNQFEYLRWPLRWSRLENAVSQFLTKTNVFFNFNCTVSPLNVLYFQDTVNWVESTIPKSRLIFPDHPVRASRCMEPLDLSLSTQELRNTCLEKYGDNHAISKLFTNLPTGNNEEIVNMLSYIQKHDTLRRTDWRKTFPDAVVFYEKFNQ
jgi:hypothetical protein